MIQPLAIEKYCDALKDRIIFNRFNMEVFIAGESLKNLTPAPQINSFVLRSLFDKWQKETDKLKSPYFDYEHPDVKEALKDYMTKLSFHIKINKDYFEVLLKEALHDCFEYLENPVFFLQTEVFDFKGNTLANKEVKSRTKFLKLYAKELDLFLNHPKISQEEVRLDVLMKVIEEIFENVNKIEEEKVFIEQISKVVPNNYINLTETRPAVEKVEKKRNFIDDLEFEGIELPEQIIEEEVSLSDTILEETNKKLETLENKINKPEATKIVETEFLISKKHSELKLSRDIPKIEIESGSNLAPIATFNAGISLQQKFYFIKELFGMNEDAYQRAVDKADEQDSFDEASNYLWDSFSETYEWAEKEEIVTELFTILNRKF